MKKWISRIITLILIGLVIGVVVGIYRKYYFNDFSKARTESGVTTFYRDSKDTCAENSSYCIDSSDYNDALFYKEISVEKNTPYKVTCKIKTENVESEDPESSGACISLYDASAQTTPILGTNDWQEVTFLVDSQESETLTICFRLGGIGGYAKGKAWFSDIHVEKGTKDQTTNWNVVCFLIDNIDVELNGTQYTYSLTSEDKSLLKENLRRFADTCEEFSNGAMTVSYQTIEITEPLTRLSYDEDNYYYVTANDVKSLINEYVKSNEYDHIFVGLRMGDTNGGIPVNEWIGLGSMKYGNAGFSDIRMPNNLANSTMYKYNESNNTFPEEVFVHEFLHSLERNLNERGYTFPAVHDYEKYGYTSKPVTGLKEWYKDYMQCSIDTASGKVGLDPIVYTTKPVQLSDFTYGEEIEFENIPHNLIDAAVQMFNTIKNILTMKNQESTTRYVEHVTITTD